MPRQFKPLTRRTLGQIVGKTVHADMWRVRRISLLRSTDSLKLAGTETEDPEFKAGFADQRLDDIQAEIVGLWTDATKDHRRRFTQALLEIVQKMGGS